MLFALFAVRNLEDGKKKNKERINEEHTHTQGDASRRRSKKPATQHDNEHYILTSIKNTKENIHNKINNYTTCIHR